MTISISIGWWIAPLAITIMLFGAAWAKTSEDRRPAGDYSFPGLGTVFAMGAATIMSLIAWLAWALLA